MPQQCLCLRSSFSKPKWGVLPKSLHQKICSRNSLLRKKGFNPAPSVPGATLFAGSLEVCPSGGGPSKYFNTAAPRFPFLNATWKAGLAQAMRPSAPLPIPFPRKQPRLLAMRKACLSVRERCPALFTVLLWPLSRKIRHSSQVQGAVQFILHNGVFFFLIEIQDKKSEYSNQRLEVM